MAYKDFDGTSLNLGENSTNSVTLQADGGDLSLPDNSYVSDADIQRDGGDLILDGAQGTITIEGYFDVAEAPTLTAPDGTNLTPQLIESFAKSPMQYAENMSMSDESPIGLVNEISGDATITRTDGTIEPLSLGSEVYQGDIVETSSDGAVNIVFTDESSFAVSEDARLAIDEYVFEPSTEEGVQNFSVLKGVFVFTSGLVGRDDPDDVSIDTPSGSIGIRGTIIAGDVDSGEITVVEGAIVLRDNAGNEMTLANQFETAKFISDNGGIQNMGQLSANDVTAKFSGVSGVAPTLFSSINDAAAEGAKPAADTRSNDREPAEAQDEEAQPPQGEDGQVDADGAVDENGDNQVDGSINTEGSEGTETQADGSPKEAIQMSIGESPLTGNNINTPAAGSTDLAGAAQAGEFSAMIDTVNFENLNTEPRQPAEEAGPHNSDNIDPSLIRNQESTHDAGPTGSAPQHASDTGLIQGKLPSIAPDEAFSTGYGQTWSYHFDKEFVDIDGDITSYKLSAATIANLAAKSISGDITSHSFDQVTGKLDLTFDGAATNDSFNIEVKAIDSEGVSSAFHSYNFEIFGDVGGTAAAFTTGINGSVYSSTIVEAINIDNIASNNKIFLGDGSDAVTITEGGSNLINLGNGDNAITILDDSDNQNNTVIGGNDTDTFTLNNAQNDLYGMDGDDTFILDLDNGTTQVDLTNATYTNDIDGGWSSFSAGDELRSNGVNYQYSQGDTGGLGDTLQINDTMFSGLDFSVVTANITGIERIDLTGGYNNLQNISYDTIVNMTDYKNTLIFRGDVSDSIEFIGINAGDTTKTEDIYITESDGSIQFDVYEVDGAHGTVTLLIEQDAGSPALGVSGLV